MDGYYWELAEEKMKASLQLYPHKEAKSYFGIRMSEARTHYFKRLHELPPTITSEILYEVLLNTTAALGF